MDNKKCLLELSLKKEQRQAAFLVIILLKKGEIRGELWNISLDMLQMVK